MKESFGLLDCLYLLPEEILVGTGLLLLLIGPFISKRSKGFTRTLALAGSMSSLLVSVLLWGRSSPLFWESYLLDAYALLLKMVFLAAFLFTVLITLSYARQTPFPETEYYALLLFATVGMMAMAAGMDLLVIYLGLEVMAIASYCLVGFLRKEQTSVEGGLKYFLLGALNSGILLYGIAFLYGTTGTTNLSLLAQRLPVTPVSPLLLLSVLLLVVGFAFKIAAVPFHMWAPDVYEGAPTPIAGFISVATKTAAFSALIRIFLVAIPTLKGDWQSLFVTLSILTMTVGNLLAIAQTNLKRLLGYSTIAHAGYLLIGAASANAIGVSALLFYFVAYLLMNLGAFGMLVHLSQKERPILAVDDLRGLATRSPLWAFLFFVFLLSLAGIPPTAGFLGKLYLFSAALKANLIPLAVIGVLNSVLALYYYFRIVRVMYMESPKVSFDFTQDSPERSRGSTPLTTTLSLSKGRRALSVSLFPWETTLALSVMGVLTLGFGLYPAPLLHLIQQATLLRP